MIGSFDVMDARQRVAAIWRLPTWTKASLDQACRASDTARGSILLKKMAMHARPKRPACKLLSCIRPDCMCILTINEGLGQEDNADGARIHKHLRQGTSGHPAQGWGADPAGSYALLGQRPAHGIQQSASCHHLQPAPPCSGWQRVLGCIRLEGRCEVNAAQVLYRVWHIVACTTLYA